MGGIPEVAGRCDGCGGSAAGKRDKGRNTTVGWVPSAPTLTVVRLLVAGVAGSEGGTGVPHRSANVRMGEPSGRVATASSRVSP